MAKMKRIFQMFENNLSIDKVAWYLLMETKIPNWEQAKKVAQDMRNDYEQENDREEKQNDSIDKRVKQAKKDFIKES